jgi:tetratricopeptide (TPR) repeat protein
LAYSYEGLKDTAKAISNMQQYLSSEADSNIIAKDYEALAAWFGANTDSSMKYYSKAVDLVKDSAARYAYFKKLAGMAATAKDFGAQAHWLGKYNTGNDRATNVDLFNWGLAYYRAGDYPMADSVFGVYTTKYPEQGFGYYWRARSNVAIDTSMERGLAIPYYQKLIELISKDTSNATNKKWLVEAYAYLAAYETNVKKDFQQAITYFEKLLQVDPDNADAKKYVDILEKRVSDTSSTK